MKTQKILKSGNSLCLSLPASLVKSLGLKPGDTVSVEVALDQSHIVYRFDQTRQLTLAVNLKK